MKSFFQNFLIDKLKSKFLTNASLICTLYLQSSTLLGATVLNTSVFALPTSQYTHIIIETDKEVSHSMVILKNPHRVVLDLKNTAISESLLMLTKRNFIEDISIKQVRLGNFKAGITRIVFDLKSEVKAVLNIEKPKDKYQHRLMIDLYPVQNEQITINSRNSGSILSNEDLSSFDSKSSGAKIILEPSYEEDEMLMEEYDQF